MALGGHNQPAAARGHSLAIVLLFLLCSLPWFLSIPGVYIFDDYITPLSDPASQGIGNFLEFFGLTLRPLTKLTYALEVALGVDSVDFRRIFQITVHLLNTLVFFYILKRLYPEETGSPVLLLLAAVVYLIHPIQAEKVLAIAGRSTLLMEGLVLGAVLAAITRKFKVGILLYIGSIFARETAFFFLPLMTVVFMPAGRKDRLLLVTLVVIALGALFSVPRYRALIDFSFAARDVVASSIQQIAAIPIGFSLYFAPWKLSIDHGEILTASIGNPWFIVGVFLYFLLFFFLLSGDHHRKLQVLWIVAALLPTQSCIPKLDALTERPFALALPGCIMFLLQMSCCDAKKIYKNILLCLLAIAVPALIFSASKRSLLYRDESAIWRDAMEKSRGNIRPYLNYATLLIDKGRIDDARAILLRADAINPFDADLADKLRMMQYKKLLKDNDR